MTKRPIVVCVILAVAGLMIAAPAAGGIEPTLPLELPSGLPSPLPSLGGLTEPLPAVPVKPDAPALDGGMGGGGVAPATGSGRADAPPPAVAPGGTGRTESPARDGGAAGVVRPAPQWPVADSEAPIGTQIGTLASNAASLARPLSLPIALAVVAILALTLATRRPRRLVKIDDEGTWGNGGTSWRL